MMLGIAVLSWVFVIAGVAWVAACVSLAILGLRMSVTLVSGRSVAPEVRRQAQRPSVMLILTTAAGVGLYFVYEFNT